MSRLGKIPVLCPASVKVTIESNNIVIIGPKGRLSVSIDSSILCEVAAVPNNKENPNVIKLTPDNAGNPGTKAKWGLYRALIQNAIIGVSTGYEIGMRVMGTGYKAEIQNNNLVLTCGHAKPQVFAIPEGVTIEVAKQTNRESMDWFVRGIDKQLVGETAAQIRRIRPPDLYQGKGIRFINEKVRKLEGKKTGGA